MNRARLKVDQQLHIGSGIVVVPTDIDSKGVRLIARGRVLGGPNDGGNFETVHEMPVGSSINLGPHVVVTLVEVRGGVARVDVFVPANVLVQSE
jgi:sRNA-binding carbon storage regulator CsrA